MYIYVVLERTVTAETGQGPAFYDHVHVHTGWTDGIKAVDEAIELNAEWNGKKFFWVDKMWLQGVALTNYAA